jgi:tetratricopeptide repeat protein
MRAFIIRPFGTRKGIDFDGVEKHLVGPALDNIGAEGRTTGEILEAGNIRIDMFQELLIADIVVADITTNNPNAFYELGIRHSLQEKRTFLIRAKLPRPQTDDELKEVDVPFDLKTDRYFEYDPGNPGASLERLTEALRETVASNRQDSPVFLSLPELKSQSKESFIPVPLGFGEEVQHAEKDKDARKLTLLGLETAGFPWETTGLRNVGRAQLLIKRYGAAKTAWESLRKLDDYDLEANTALGNIYQRLDDLTSSNLALDRALKVATSPSDLAEIHGQLGRNKKDLWTRSWSTAASTDEKARNAIDSPLLLEAHAQYLEAYRLDLNSYYPGLNALFLAIIILELATRYPDVWSGPFADQMSANVKLDEIKRKRDQMALTLQLRFDSADAPVQEGAKQDIWLLSSAGDLNLLTQPPNPRRASYFYKKAAAIGGDFVLDSARRQLVMLTQIGVLSAQIEEVLKSFPPESAPATNQRIDRVLLFTGHRIDSVNRAKPRFPANKEAAAREAIRTAVAQEKDLTSGSILGIAGGANGGDILFLEVCDDLGIKTEMLLALPQNQFIEASVDNENKNWLRRFHAQLEKRPNVPVLADSTELPKWLQFKRGYDIWQRNNLWLLSEALCLAPKNLTVIGLWDGEAGDGPGGTEHMISFARDRGARFIRLDTKKLFDLT